MSSTNTPECPRCKISMKIGIGINPTDPDFLRNAIGHRGCLITADNIRLDKVWKCSQCGYSKDL